ncbi:hypothetical protein N0V93_001950 [Gnomoniopsis smithogilvyi]|uniref:Uncharacterized protein n=1 Tax=Gnomoniopsis smithogilvyi TaxID=1191159 RepID=A0A9W9D338_9PEZI|nr:hypothetical protein N0V93_001950 [Gnomoniopsis smithogilvyi]
MASWRAASGEDIAHEKQELNEDQAYSHIRSAITSTNSEAPSASTAKQSVTDENPPGGTPKSLHALSQSARLLAGLKDEGHQKEYEKTPTPYPSLASATSDSEKEDENDSEQDKLRGGSRGCATTPQSGNTNISQKYAFNFAGEAYNHNVPYELTNGITIHVGSLAPMTTTLKQRREEVHNDAVPPLIPRTNEFQKGPKTVECVWIGMLPSAATLLRIPSQVSQSGEDASGEGSSKKPARKRVRKTKSVFNMREDEIQPIKFDQNALRVVAKTSGKVTKDTHIYALLHPSHADGLQGFKVGFDDVYYFSKFRDDKTKSFLPRKQATIARIRASTFSNPALAALQSPRSAAGESSNKALNTIAAESPVSSLSTMATPTPPPLNPASQTPEAPTDEVALSILSSSRTTPQHKEKEKAGSISLNKRKAQDPAVDSLMNQKGEARKKARAGGGYVSPCDSEICETVEYHSQDAPAHRAEYNEKSPMEPTTVSLRGPRGQIMGKNSKVAQSTNTNRNGDKGGDEDQNPRISKMESDILAKKIKEMANKLAAKEDVAGLQQVLAMLRCIQNRSGPPKTSALGVYLNVPSSKHILTADCAEQMNQLRALFQGLEGHNDMQDHVLGWIVKGLQMTGQSLRIDILHPYLIAFAELYEAKFPAGQNNRMLRDELVDMICCARDKAEEMLRLAAIERGSNRASLRAEGDCPSHPYYDPNEVFVSQPTIWERPE